MDKKFLLVIDNIDDELTSIIESLKNQGHQVEINHNLDSILSSFSKGKYNVMFVGISSPGISVLDFIKNVKTIDPLVQIITIADNQSEDAAVNALKYGAYYLLKKPICRESALALINNAIKYADVKSENLKLKTNGSNGDSGKHYNENGEIDWSIDTMEKFHIINVLNVHKWNISRSAQKLKIDRVTLYNKIKKYGLRNSVK